jgi:hypothetical protein
LTKIDSTNAFGLHGLSVGSAWIGMVMVPPVTGAPVAADVAADGPGWAVLAHADATKSVTNASAKTRGITARGMANPSTTYESDALDLA